MVAVPNVRIVTLEDSINAPIVVFTNRIEFVSHGSGAAPILKRYYSKNEVEDKIGEMIPFKYQDIEAIYDTDGSPKWQNLDFEKHRKIVPPEHLI